MSETIIKINGGVIRQQKNTILKDVNIDIKNGEFVYLIGKVGSGKSSFLKTLYAELPLEFGTGEVAGFQLKKIKKSQIPMLRRKCGIVFQDFKLLTDRNVYANLEFVLRATGWDNKKAIRERIETVLEKVGMSDKKEKMPHQLSGGEQQRIVLARALLNAPPIILADEPTGNIDPETSYKLVELLREICDTGKTIIIATHQYDLIEKYPGRVLRCENGQLFENTPAVTSENEDNTLQPETIEEITITAEVVTENVDENAGTPETATVEELTFTEVVTFDEEEEHTEPQQPELTFIETSEAETDLPEQEHAGDTETAPEAVTEEAATEEHPETTPEEQDTAIPDTTKGKRKPKAVKEEEKEQQESQETLDKEKKTEKKARAKLPKVQPEDIENKDEKDKPVFGFELIE